MWSNMYSPDKPKVRKRVDWRRIGALFSPYWRQQSLVLFCIVVSALVGLAPAYFIAHIIDKAIPHGNFREVAIDVGGMLAAALVTMLLTVAQGYLNSIVGEGIMRDMRTSLVSHLHRMPLKFFTGTKTGEIMNRVSNDVDNIDNVVTGTFTTLLTNFVTILTTVVWMFFWNWRLALLSIAIVPLMVLPLSPVGRRMYEIRRRTREKRDEIESITQETLSISGITLIKSFAREAYEKARFFKAGTELMELEVRLAMVGRWFIAAITAMVIIGPAIVWLGGGWLALSRSIAIGVVVAFVQYIQQRLYGPAASLAGIQVQIVSALAVFERIFDYLDMAPEEYEPQAAVTLSEVHGEIRFDNVTFGYSSERTVLDGIDLHIQPGQVAAFVGPSGGGKTTITQFVPRFYDPNDGRVLIDGYDVRTLTLESLRRGVGIVTQETYLFHDTVDFEFALRQAGRNAGGAARRGSRGEHRRFHHVVAGRLRHGRGRARSQTFRRRTPTLGDCASAAQESENSHSRRSHQRAGLAQRSGHTSGARSAYARANDACNRAPPLDDFIGGRHLRSRSRSHSRTRHSCRAPGPQRRIRALVSQAIPGRIANYRVVLNEATRFLLPHLLDAPERIRM